VDRSAPRSVTDWKSEEANRLCRKCDCLRENDKLWVVDHTGWIEGGSRYVSVRKAGKRWDLSAQGHHGRAFPPGS
jgi:hypothetical protein